MSHFRKLLVAHLFLILAALPALQAVSVTDLRCEDLDNPLGVDALQPRLSWILLSNERNQMQTAREILVASSQQNLTRNVGDLWDSGKILSDQSIQIPYGGKPLVSREQCFWKVRAWDKNGKASAWSRSAFWTMGVLTTADWNGAKWIGLDGKNVTDYLAGANWIWFPSGAPEKSTAPATNYFRKVIVIPFDRKIMFAKWVYTGDSECRGWLNSSDLGARNSFHTVRDDDITGRLDPGTTIVLGLTGYNFGARAKPAGVVGLLAIDFDHGPPMLIPTDDSWKVSNKEIAGWDKVGFDDSNWLTARKLGPVGMKPWGNVRISESRRLPACYLRKEFSVEKKVVRATVSFSGMGLSEAYLNGAKIGNAVLSPAFTQYNKRSFYVTYDVTKDLRRGPNAIGVILGNGRFYADRSRVYSGTENFGWPKLLFNLRIEFSDGSHSEFISDNSWKLTTNGPIIANNDYDGEEYDARKEFPGWDEAGFDDSKWRPAQNVLAPDESICAQMQEPIRVTETVKPVSCREVSPGVFIYDLGQNISGWCRLRVSGPAGTQVALRHAETLRPDGSLYLANLRGARATDVYSLKGKGMEVWEPRFVTHGFRYVEVTEFPGRPDLNSIEGRVVSDDLPVAGNFGSSNPLLNKIYRAVAWSVRDNYRSIPTDCPQRDERQGWLGDRSEESRGETFLFDNLNLYADWIQDISDAQRASGSLPDIAPTYWPIYSDNVAWPSTFIIIPEMLREQYGDTQTIARHYDCAKRWMDYMGRWLTNGIIARDSYGDWCVPPENPLPIHSQDPNRTTDNSLIATAYFYHDCRLMEDNARVVGKNHDAQQFESLARGVKATLNEKFLDRDKGQYSNGTQTSCVLPLAFGLVPDDMRERIFNHLVDEIVNESDGHIGTGLIGAQYLMRVLTENGRPDLAYKIASQRDYPSWGYMIEHGATTIWELWNGDTADPTMNSDNHVMLVGDLVIWLYEDVGGIKSDPAQPAFKHIIMRPTPTGDLTWVKATHNSPYGRISSEWHRDGNDGSPNFRFDWRIEVPANSTATVFVPASNLESVQANDIYPVGFENGRAIFELGSGKYHFVSK